MSRLNGMVSRSRAVADDELSDIVRRRLEALLADIPPRRAASGHPSDRTAPPPRRAPASTERQPPDEQQPSGPQVRRTEPDEADDMPVEGEAGAESWVARRRLDARAGQPAVRAEPGPQPDDREPAAESPPAGVAGAARRALALAAGSGKVRQFVRDHLLVVGIVVLTGCLWAGYSVFQARTTPVAMAAAQPSVEVSVATPSASPTPTILVHVLGQVRRPGVVELPQGARVQDALAAAGGLTAKAAPGDLNLAAEVTDGAQLVIGRRDSELRGNTGSDAGGGTASSPAPVDLNTATLAQLDALPGVGPVTAQKILAWRDSHSRFRSVAELQEVDGIGPKTYAELAPHVRV